MVPLPRGLSLRESMIYGTAGFTAALSLDALRRHGLTPSDGEIVVSGASGGVGSIARHGGSAGRPRCSAQVGPRRG